jgi:high affinity Mn2+ porin
MNCCNLLKSLMKTFLIVGATLTLCVSVRADEDQSANIHLQSTVVSQEHGPFPANYSGKNSLTSSADNQTSVTWTIFAGLKLWKGGEFYINPELSSGSGFDKTHGLAGFPNGEIYRVDDPGAKWSLARLIYKQVFSFGGEKEEIKDDKNQLAASVSSRRLTTIIGKFALNDYFDANSYAHDPRTQFLNWTLMDNGSWDYAADTRGYSWGFYLEYNDPQWAVRFASVLVPLQANQMEMDKEYPPAMGLNLEFESRWAVSEKKGIARFLAWENHAGMGNYRNTINRQPRPLDADGNLDVTQTRQMSDKYGFGINIEQALSNDLGAFLRIGWDDGKTETWAFTEIDQNLSVGLSLKGTKWNRPSDVVGAAYMLNGISQDHRDYLALGGMGFMIGDGTLNYGPEHIGEIYYSYRVFPGFDATGDFQYFQNPAYNADRGPVSVCSFRIHYEI